MNSITTILGIIATTAFEGDPDADPPATPKNVLPGEERPTFQYTTELIELPDCRLLWVE